MSGGSVRYRLLIQDYRDNSRLSTWTCEKIADFLPLPGEMVVLWEYPGEDGEGEMWPVKRRYWRNLGFAFARPTLELAGMCIDPPWGTTERIQAECAGWARHPWWTTANSPDPYQELRAAHWRSDQDDQDD